MGNVYWLGISSCLVVTVALAGLTSCDVGSPVEAKKLEVLSQVYTIDREYRSMMGPSSNQTVSFPEFGPPELVWVTGSRTEVVDRDGQHISQEFMCHANLDFDSQRHSSLFEVPKYQTNQLFRLSQGQQEIRFPEGFGLPFYTDEEFSLTTQVLNLNFNNQSHQVRHKVTIEYVLDRDLDTPMKPLFMTSGWGLVLLEGEHGYYGVENPDEAEHGEGCLPGETAGPDVYQDGTRRFSGHWVVKPGREVNRTLVTEIMDLPYDTTVHTIAVHLHPFAEVLELVDLTTGESVFKSNVEWHHDKIGLKRVDYFTSKEGIPVYKDHEYELISTYNNTTSEDQDSMAVMLLYLFDKKFEKKERLVRARLKGPLRVSEERVVLHTSMGDVTIGLYWDVAPRHVAQFLELVELGVYDTTLFSRVEPGFLVQTGYPHVRRGTMLTATQRSAIRHLRAEFSELSHRRGIVSMVLNDNDDPHSAEASFFILLRDAPVLDRKYTIFGEVTDGLETLDRMTEVPRDAQNFPLEAIEIRSAEIVTAPAEAARSAGPSVPH